MKKAVLAVAGAVVLICGSAAWGQEQTGAAGVSVLQDATKAEDVLLSLGEETITVSNLSGVSINEASAHRKENAKQDGNLYEITLRAKDGEEHIFEDVPETMNEPELSTEDGFLFITYLNENREKKTAYENAEEIFFDEPVSRYITDQVNIRTAASAESDIVGVAALGSEVKAVSALPRWIGVELEDGKTGYIARRYVSPNKEDADQAVNAENAARAAQEAAAAAAAAAAVAAGSYTDITVVSQQNFDDCDGSGHGYSIITYSDGSTETVEY